MRWSKLVVLIALLGTMLPAVVAQAVELTDPLKTLQAVGPKGQGHKAATQAWSIVAQADASQLPELLSALDDASTLGSNWIRAAVDTVAERQLQSGGKLPEAALEKFILETNHTPRGRRLAFEWLTRVDAAAPDRLVPQFLHDPSVEFRRDAVARLMTAGDARMAKDDKAAAAKIYQEALGGARDLDQIQLLFDQLKTLGVEVDLPSHFGFIMQWQLVGPFDNTKEAGFDVANPPEAGPIDFAAEYDGKSGKVKWQLHDATSDLGMVNLNAALGKASGVTAYAFANYVSDKEQPVEIRLGSINAAKVWLNGELITQTKVYHSGSDIDQFIAKVTLKEGDNAILVKVLQNEQTDSWAQDWQFQLRVCDSAGTAILAQNRPPRVKPPEPAAEKPAEPAAAK